jgi:predicted GNAT superfamily acetyltransferase
MTDTSEVSFSIRILDTPEELEKIEDLERVIWPGSETDVIPSHLLLAAVHGGGLVIGAFDDSGRLHGAFDPPPLIGFVFGFPGLYYTPDGPRLKHCSHQLGVLPRYRNTGIGSRLKRAQWQMVRHQGIDRITWTFDPLLSRNAYLNITKLGAVSNTYLRNFYGDMRDEMNQGLPSDRFEVDWWVNSRRVERRLSKKRRPQLGIGDFKKVNASIIPPLASLPELSPIANTFVLIEIPADFPSLKANDPSQALGWRLHTRMVFEALFGQGYVVTDFIHDEQVQPRSFYVLSHGDATL